MRQVQLTAVCIAAVTAKALSAQADSGRQNRVATFADYVQQEAQVLGMPLLPRSTAGTQELRIWYGFGLYGTGVVRLWRIGDTWRVCRHPAGGETSYTRIEPESPSDSVAAVWKAAVDSGLFLLPRFPERGGDPRYVFDGSSYVIESFDGSKYRVAEANNPGVFQSPDDRRLESVVSAVFSRWPYETLPRCRRF